MPVKTDTPFFFDGCSVWFEGNWRHCCYSHDRAYHVGGTYWERLRADYLLAHCVYRTKRVSLKTLRDLMSYNNWVLAIPRPIIASMMFIGVQIFGMGIFPTPFRWGFGWRWPKTGP